MSKAMYACRSYGKLHAMISGGRAIDDLCEETLAMQVTLPRESWPLGMPWSCLACGKR